MSLIFSNIRSHFRSRLAEWIISTALFVWGFIIFSDPTLFLRDNFANMISIAPHYVWGGGAMLVASTRILFLSINGLWRPSAHLRALGSFLSFMGWATIISCYITLPVLIPNVATIGALAALDFCSMLFAAEDASRADSKAKEPK